MVVANRKYSTNTYLYNIVKVKLNNEKKNFSYLY